MRLLVVSDPHSSAPNAELLANMLSKAKIDAVLVCGDFTNEGSVSIAEEIVTSLGKIAKVYAVPGNMDSEEVAGFLRQKGIGMHKEKKKLGDYVIIGIGGAKPINTYYRINLSESEAEKYLNRLSEGEKPEKTILLFHSPPYGTRLSMSSSGTDLGVMAIRAFIEKFQPLLVACGHVHEAIGIEKIGRTVCINPGPLRDGFYAIAEISGSGEIKITRGSVYGKE